ncbi:hypothetical protein HGRIS_006951 [Hohenbuehelia grisea]|uniref:NAD-dependent epimerase/dehydratase domain-containing protein n=1 Tax=Hohenbuehelia grisea TaxID=104357 RepID=A0ABR3JAZ9_9AGAR
MQCCDSIVSVTPQLNLITECHQSSSRLPLYDDLSSVSRLFCYINLLFSENTSTHASSVMPFVDPPPLILVTGVNGHLESTTALRLLQKGYRARGTVRTLQSAKYVTDGFIKLGVGDNFSLVEVANISALHAFAQAVKDADAVAHIASPVTLDATRPEEQYVPAVEGSVNLLKTIVEYGPGVKKLIFMGSIGSVIMTKKYSYKEVVTPDDWNVVTDELVKISVIPLSVFTFMWDPS